MTKRRSTSAKKVAKAVELEASPAPLPENALAEADMEISVEASPEPLPEGEIAQPEAPAAVEEPQPEEAEAEAEQALIEKAEQMPEVSEPVEEIKIDPATNMIEGMAPPPPDTPEAADMRARAAAGPEMSLRVRRAKGLL
jgi:hypothetical protein